MSGGFQPPEHLVIAETDDWLLNHRVDAALPGYLMLATKAPCKQLAAMGPQALSQLGLLMATAQEALEAVLAPKHLYIGRYGNDAGFSLHFHIIPVCDWVVQGFLADKRYRYLESLRAPGHAAPGGADGPDGADLTLYIWRAFCESPHPPDSVGLSIGQTVEKLRAFFAAGHGQSDPALRSGSAGLTAGKATTGAVPAITHGTV
jgi:diadenosine tetraphosphate (Ap4A) HIT family hydrolase